MVLQATLCSLTKSGVRTLYYFLNHVSFNHGPQCDSKIVQPSGVLHYNISNAILETSSKLQGLAEKWWKSVSPNPHNSILNEYDKGKKKTSDFMVSFTIVSPPYLRD
jgi:hypothetical protein